MRVSAAVRALRFTSTSKVSTRLALLRRRAVRRGIAWSSPHQHINTMVNTMRAP